MQLPACVVSSSDVAAEPGIRRSGNLFDVRSWASLLEGKCLFGMRRRTLESLGPAARPVFSWVL